MVLDHAEFSHLPALRPERLARTGHHDEANRNSTPLNAVAAPWSAVPADSNGRVRPRVARVQLCPVHHYALAWHERGILEI